MFKKTFALLFSGIFLLCLFSFFSSFPQLPGDVNSVHLFTYQCMLDTVEYSQLSMDSNIEEEAEDCHFNLRLSLLVTGYGISGIGLIVYSLRRIKGLTQTN